MVVNELELMFSGDCQFCPDYRECLYERIECVAMVNAEYVNYCMAMCTEYGIDMDMYAFMHHVESMYEAVVTNLKSEYYHAMITFLSPYFTIIRDLENESVLDDHKEILAPIEKLRKIELCNKN